MRKTFLVLALLLAACTTSQSDKVTTSGDCTASDFTYSVGTTEGAAGSSYTPLVFTNSSSRECELQGVPKTQVVEGQRPIGPLSEVYQSQNSNDTVKVKPGESASVLLVVAEASNYPSEQCLPESADGVTLSFKDLTATFNLPAFQVCTKLSSTFVSAVAPGNGG